jgi:hypothetical protein
MKYIMIVPLELLQFRTNPFSQVQNEQGFSSKIKVPDLSPAALKG